MYTFFTVLILIVCLLLVLTVLVQNSKGGGLASNFSEAGQVMGVRKTTDFLEKATWTLAISLMVLTLFAAGSLPGGAEAGEEAQASRIAKQVQRTNAGVQATELPEAPIEASDAAPAGSEEEATTTQSSNEGSTPAE
ncbi:MAG: preprotein translocase subunit SecG [Bacteroidetes bacterium]|nr:MAG: preprotein translocase subunit SecG [Bacteroidota bacterium]